MTMEIYWGAGSPYAWRVLLAAEIKRIPYESKLLEFSKGQLKTPEFLAMNPRGKVPVIRDGDFVLAESLAIVAYLDRKVAEPPLFGRTPEETGRVWAQIAAFESYMRDPMTVVNRWLFGDKPRTPELDEAIGKATAEIERVEELLGRSAWLVGDAVSGADLVWFPTLRTIIRAGVRAEARTTELGLYPFVDKYPNIGAWIARVEGTAGLRQDVPAALAVSGSARPIAGGRRT
jgi:glutathione S-transferase